MGMENKVLGLDGKGNIDTTYGVTTGVLNASNIPESILPDKRKVDLEMFTAFELTCLVRDIYYEAKMRKEFVPSTIQQADYEISQHQHDIEFSEEVTNTEKIARYNKLTTLLGDRRKAKQENVAINRLYKHLDLDSSNKAKIVNLNFAINTALDESEKVNGKPTEFKQGEFKRFRKKYYVKQSSKK